MKLARGGDINLQLWHATRTNVSQQTLVQIFLVFFMLAVFVVGSKLCQGTRLL